MDMLSKFGVCLAKISLIASGLKKIHRNGGFVPVVIGCVNSGETLKGKKILITGGGSGIGLAIARKCVNEGATVVITGRNREKLAKASAEIGTESVKFIEWDITKIEEIESKIKKTKEELGGEIDILVNNAGILDVRKFPNVEEKAWDAVYATNSKGVFFTTQHVCKKWLDTTGSNIRKVINISSQGGFVGATYPYRMTKWDIAGLTQGLGIRLAPHGIIVNGIAPGVVATAMQADCLDQAENLFYADNPIQRFALPEEIAELACFLMSDACNFIVGQTIVCDGGYSIK